MFIALDSNMERVSIENAIADEQYFCPICGKPLTIRATKSTVVKTHFAHKRGMLCYDDWTNDMSEWHLSWQKSFPEQYREVVIEKDGNKHRADICINNTVIEFQHSPITGEEIAKRNDFYLSCGYDVVWVFDASDKIQNRIEGPIDPMLCRADDLCWKRARAQFAISIHPKVKIYLQYKTTIARQGTANEEVDVMLLVTKLTPKNITFYPTYNNYIFPENFLKEYGVTTDNEVLSISEIVKRTQMHVQRELARKREEERNRMMKRILAKEKNKRRWYFRF